MALTISELSKPGYLRRIYSTINSKAAIQKPIIYYHLTSELFLTYCIRDILIWGGRHAPHLSYSEFQSLDAITCHSPKALCQMCLKWT